MCTQDYTCTSFYVFKPVDAAGLAQSVTCETQLCWLQISEVAGKESSIEVALDKMAAEWANAEMSVLDYRDTGTFVIKLDEAVLQQLDDHIGAYTRASYIHHTCAVSVHEQMFCILMLFCMMLQQHTVFLTAGSG